MKLAIAGLVLACAASASAQKLDVKIVDRQDNQDEYDYAALFNNVAAAKTFKVRGATFTLQLPDGRGAVVNCESKFAEHMAGCLTNSRDDGLGNILQHLSLSADGQTRYAFVVGSKKQSVGCAASYLKVLNNITENVTRCAHDLQW